MTGVLTEKNIYLRFRSTYLFSVITLAEVVVDIKNDVQVSVMTADNIAKTVWSLIFAVLVVIDNFWHGRLIVITRVLIHTEFASYPSNFHYTLNKLFGLWVMGNINVYSFAIVYMFKPCMWNGYP